MKKLLSIILSLLISTSVLFVPLTSSAASYYGHNDVDFYVADCLAFGITDPLTGKSNGQPQVSMAVNHNYVYKSIAEAVIEDGGLIFNSLYWQNLRKAIDGKFLEIGEWEQALYVTLLLDYLNYYTNSEEYKSNLAKNSVKFANQIYTNILDYADETYYEDVDHLINNVSLSEAIEFSNKYGYVTRLKEYNTLAQDISKVGTKGLDYFKKLSKVLALQQANENTVDFLVQMKEYASNNRNFCMAVDKVAVWYKASYAGIAFSQSIPTMVGYMFEAVFDYATNEYPPLASVFKEIKVYTAGLNWLFNSDDISENNLKITLLYIVRSYAVQAIYDSKEQYASVKSSKNAAELINNFYCYLNFEKYASDSAKGFISSALFDGLWNNIKNIFSDSNELTYSQLTSKIDADISFCTRMEALVNRFYDVFSASEHFEDNKIAEDLDVERPEGGGTTVNDYVQFSMDEMTLFMNGVLINPAVSYPYSSSLVYSSGNSSIATVDQNGKITPVNPGTVKIYATTLSGAKGSCTITVTPFYANEISGGVEITNFVGTSTIVNVPSIIQQRKVISIGKNAFDWKSNIREVSLSSSIKNISDYAFYYCSSLQKINLPDSITSIGESAFGGCKSLISVSLPSNITEISDNLFYDAESLSNVNIPNKVSSIGTFAFADTNIENINIPDSVKTIKEYAFSDCENLKKVFIGSGVSNIQNRVFDRANAISEITVNPVNSYYAAEDNILFNKNKNLIILYPAGKTNTEYTIPSTVNSIGNEAFAYNNNLLKVTIPDTVTSCGSGVFTYCGNLKEVILPNNMTNIPSSMFNYCSELESISLPISIKSIGSTAFMYCESLSSIEIPSKVQSIGGSAFWGCSNLKNINIPNSVTELGSGAFGYCSSAENLKIGNGITNIYEETFYSCSGIKNIEFGAKVKQIDYGAFGFLTSIESLTFSDSIETISDYSFMGCENLKTVYLGKGLKNIGDYAFEMCNENLRYRAHKDTAAYDWIKSKSFKYTVVLDVSGDDSVNAGDLSALKKYFIINSSVTAEADCNQDGKIDIRDLVHLKKYLAAN